jgi:hypothetical protein
MDFTAADTYGVVSALANRETDVVAGVTQLLDHCNRLSPSPVWREIAALDLGRGRDGH